MDVISRVQWLSSLWLLGLCCGVPMLGAIEFDGLEHRERLFVRQFEQRYETSLRDSIQREVIQLCKDVAKAVNLSDVQGKALEEKLKPVVSQALEAWRLALRIHYQTMPTVEDAESFSFLGDALLHPDVAAADAKAMQLWDSILAAELGDSAFARWKLREKELRADHAKASAAVTAKLIAQAAKAKTTFWQAKIKRVAAAVGWHEDGVKTLVNLAIATAQSFENGFAERMKEVEPKADELLLGCSTDALAELRRRQTRTLYPPRMRSLQEETQRVIDDAISQRLSADEKKKLADHEAELNTRLTEAVKEAVKGQLERGVPDMVLVGNTRLALLGSVLKLPRATVDSMDKAVTVGEEEAKAVWTSAIQAVAVSRVPSMVKDRDVEDVIQSLEQGAWRWSDEAADRQLASQRQSLWQAAVKAHLTPDQQQQWFRYEEEQRERRTLALTKLTVSELDVKVRLQANQREALEVALRPVAQKVAQIPGGMRVTLQSGSLDGSLMLLEGLEKGRLEQLLTPSQMTQVEAMSSRYKAYWRTVQAKLDLLEEDRP